MLRLLKIVRNTQHCLTASASKATKRERETVIWEEERQCSLWRCGIETESLCLGVFVTLGVSLHQGAALWWIMSRSPQWRFERHPSVHTFFFRSGEKFQSLFLQNLWTCLGVQYFAFYTFFFIYICGLSGIIADDVGSFCQLSFY